MHLLYVTLTEQEKRLGAVWLAIVCLSCLVFPLRPGAAAEGLYQGVLLLGTVLIFRKFLAASLRVPLTTPGQIPKMAFLGLTLAGLANLLTNDLLYYFFPRYFFYNDTGPHFYNVMKEEVLRSHLSENFPLTTVTVIVFVPLWEETLHRGLVFGALVRKNLPLAYGVSIALYSLLPVIPLLGTYPPVYILLSFIQYIPISVLFAWVYTRTETILTPILAHMAMNAVSIFAMR